MRFPQIPSPPPSLHTHIHIYIHIYICILCTPLHSFTYMFCVCAHNEPSKNLGSRASKVIKFGCDFAIIRIEIYNEGDDAYRSDVYGDIICVEKRVTLKGQAIKLISEQGKTISTSVSELNAITDQVNSIRQLLSVVDPITHVIPLYFYPIHIIFFFILILFLF